MDEPRTFDGGVMFGVHSRSPQPTRASVGLTLQNPNAGSQAATRIDFAQNYGGAFIAYCNYGNTLCLPGENSFILSALSGSMNLWGSPVDIRGGSNIKFQTGLSGTFERVRITEAGDVGIGTSTPSAMLHVVDSAPQNDAPAVLGEHNVTDNYGIGVRGVGRWKGVEGIVEPTGSSYYYGVYGYAGKNTGNTGDFKGVYGYAHGGSVAYGVYGTASGATTNYAGYFSGNVRVNGTLTKNGGSFKIDHPLDPDHKYLSHSFVESPDMMNVYNGNVVLDSHGEAWVELSDWFEALNRDFRYQLTAIGGPGPGLYIAEKVSGNRFKIAGGSAGLEVSWQLTGIRHDAWAEANRIVVEEDKLASERGRYLNPEVLGQSPEKAIHREELKSAAEALERTSAN